MAKQGGSRELRQRRATRCELTERNSAKGLSHVIDMGRVKSSAN